MSNPVPSQPPAPVKDNPYEVLRNRDFTQYMTGRFISAFSQQMLALAVGWDVYNRTKSPRALGLVGLAQVLPMFLFTFHAGHLADNHSRNKIMVWMQILVAVAGSILALDIWFHLGVSYVYFALFLLGTSRTYGWAASAAFVPQLVPRELFPLAVSWNTAAFQIASVTGPAVGGALIAWLGKVFWIYAFNASAGILCAILFLNLKVHHKVKSREPMSLKSVIVGLKFVYHTKVVLGSITLDMFAVLLGGASALLPVYAKDILNTNPSGLGWLQAALPIGSMCMSLLLLHQPPMKNAGATLLWAVAGFGLATVGFGLSRNIYLSFTMLFICGATDYISVIVRQTMIQLKTPDHMRGRVSAVNSLFIGTSNQLGEFESGMVAQYTSPVFSVVSGGIGTILVVITAAFIWPEIRNYKKLDS